MGQNAEKIIFVARNTHKYVAKEGSRNLVCRRAPHGARGLKHRERHPRPCERASRPAWGAWIETLSAMRSRHSRMSRPAWGAWIETVDSSVVQNVADSSRPAWGAWIETISVYIHSVEQLSRPAWGAWIETLPSIYACIYILSRPAWGAWIETTQANTL